MKNEDTSGKKLIVYTLIGRKGEDYIGETRRVVAPQALF